MIRFLIQVPGENAAVKVYLKNSRGYAIIGTEKPAWLSEKTLNGLNQRQIEIRGSVDDNNV
jgi:hypothetical protein